MISKVWINYCELLSLYDANVNLNSTHCLKEPCQLVRSSLDIVLSPYRTQIFRFGAVKVR